ncbi:hypothetical protein, partial [Nocardioides sp.]|uniref:hypothetical protein n=1 Tax=Nocardioides sp. TaxID=35761 RepID=UPI0027345C0E
MRRLGYVALAYGSVGMITNSMWDRFVWAVLALAILANLDDESEPDQPESADKTPGVSAR